LWCASVSSHVAWREASKGLDAASNGYGKTLLSFRFVGIHELPSFNAAKSCSPTSPNQTQIGKRGKKTIFDLFRDKPARFLRHCRITHLIRAYDFTPYQITAFTGWSMKSTFQQMGVQASSNIDIYSHLEWKDYIDKLLVPLSEII